MGDNIQKNNNVMPNTGVIISREKGVWIIEWPTTPLSAETFRVIRGHFLTRRDYGPNSTANISDEIRLLAPTDQILAIRSIVIKEKIIKNYWRMNNEIKRIASEYHRGEDDILALSSKWDFPPLTLMHGILLHLYPQKKKTIYMAFRGKGSAETKHADIAAARKEFSTRDQEQLTIADINDAESLFNQRLAAEKSYANEMTFVEWFRGHGVGIRTQEDMVAEQVRDLGRAVLTPDILFTDDVVVNGISCAWIDYKDYIGTTIAFLAKSNRDQAAKYIKKWGPGALAYHRGIVSDLVTIIPNDCQLLDVRVFPINLKK